MEAKAYDMGPIDIAWCPGCGNFPILRTLKEALAELDLDPTQVVLVSGIGQAAKTPHYVKTNVFNGLHGRALPPATAIKACNPRLTVIVESGDGDTYGPGAECDGDCNDASAAVTSSRLASTTTISAGTTSAARRESKQAASSRGRDIVGTMAVTRASTLNPGSPRPSGRRRLRLRRRGAEG